MLSKLSHPCLPRWKPPSSSHCPRPLRGILRWDYTMPSRSRSQALSNLPHPSYNLRNLGPPDWIGIENPQKTRIRPSESIHRRRHSRSQQMLKFQHPHLCLRLQSPLNPNHHHLPHALDHPSHSHKKSQCQDHPRNPLVISLANALFS